MTKKMVALKKTLFFLGGIFILQCVVLLFLCVGWHNINKSGLEFSASTVAALGDKWDYKELASRADPQMFAGHPEAETVKTLSVISRLGKLQSIQMCVGEASIDAASSHFVLVGQYSCKAQFEKDVAVVTFILTRNYGDILSFRNIFGNANENWKILKFNIASDYLLKAAPTQ